MTALGFKWLRQTVTEAERGRRRITVEEALGLSVALQVPMDTLLYPPPGEVPEVALPGGHHTIPAGRPWRDLTSLREEGDVIIAAPSGERRPEPELPPRTVNFQAAARAVSPEPTGK